MTSETELSVMVVDDEPGIRTALRANFLRHGWRVETASCVRDAIRTVQDREFDLVVTDIRMPDGSGMEVMRAARKASPGTAVILLTAYGSVSDAVSAMRDGALDYLTKPIPFDRLQATAAQVMERAKQLPVEDIYATGDIIGRSPLLLRAIQRARAAASTGADVLIEAESGTGKELLARFIHDSSDRSRKPFIAVNCAAVPEALLRANSSGTGEALSPVLLQPDLENSNSQTAARFSSTKSEKCPFTCNRNSFGHSRNVNLRGSVKDGPSMSISASSQQPMFHSLRW